MEHCTKGGIQRTLHWKGLVIKGKKCRAMVWQRPQSPFLGRAVRDRGYRSAHEFHHGNTNDGYDLIYSFQGTQRLYSSVGDDYAARSLEDCGYRGKCHY